MNNKELTTYDLIQFLRARLNDDLHKENNNEAYVNGLMNVLLGLADLKKFY